MNITVQEVCDICGGELLSGRPDTVLRHISIDSRKMQGEDLFIPIRGERTDGHNYIAGAFARGAAATLTERREVLPQAPEGDRPYILVQDSTLALQRLGGTLRKAFRGPVVGITGSVGKTTTREMTMAALRSAGRVTGSLANHNSQLGVPVTLCHMDYEADFAVAEMGVSMPGEMTRLVEMVCPRIVIVTNIGVAHIEYLGSREGICREKMHITDKLGPEDFAVLNGDEPLLLPYKNSLPCRVLTYGQGKDCDLRAEAAELGETASFTAVFSAGMPGGPRSIPVTLSVPGAHNVMNALAALGCAAALGLDPEAAAAGLEAFGGFDRRLERLTLQGISLIDDSYNASPASMKAALKVLTQSSAEGRRIALLADMLELGSDSGAMHREVGEMAAKLPLDLFITLGKEIRSLEEPLLAAGKNLVHADSPEEALQLVRSLVRPGDCLLLKGSNGMHLDLVRRGLEA